MVPGPCSTLATTSEDITSEDSPCWLPHNPLILPVMSKAGTAPGDMQWLAISCLALNGSSMYLLVRSMQHGAFFLQGRVVVLCHD